jgi:hypothetical protein
VEKIRMLYATTLATSRGRAERLKLLTHSRQRDLGEEPVDAFRSSVEGGGEEVGASAGRVEHSEPEERRRRNRWIVLCQFPNSGQVLL